MAVYCQRIFDFMIRCFRNNNDDTVGNGREKSNRNWTEKSLSGKDRAKESHKVFKSLFKLHRMIIFFKDFDLLVSKKNKVVDFRNGLVRFEERKETFIWAHQDEIRFVKSADHYINALIQQDQQMKWMIRHSTLKELLAIVSMGNFIRLNRFYVINRKFYSHIDLKLKILYLTDVTPIPLAHRISPFVMKTIKG